MEDLSYTGSASLYRARSVQIFKCRPAVTKDVFVTFLFDLENTPPLRGPYLAAPSASIENDAVAEHLFDGLVLDGKEKLTKYHMSLKLTNASVSSKQVDSCL
mmetsp:Transcript_420/g.624  ORF Transcript_420/g.624 Transcript_420/m.624 type:complete len:102 (+) Transcript_420:353-658(+)